MDKIKITIFLNSQNSEVLTKDLFLKYIKINDLGK